MKPDFVVIGAQKGGSTALARFLAAHPAVYLPAGETRWFRDPWFRFEAPTVLDDAVAPAGPGVVRRGIKSPDLLGQDTAPERIREVLGPEVDLLAVLRHPVHRAVSAYFWMAQYGLLPGGDVEAALTAVADGRWDDEPHAAALLENGFYARHLRRYRDVFGPDHVLALLDTDLRGDTTATLGRVADFLGVDPTGFPPALAGRSVNEGVYAPLRLRVLAARHRVLRRSWPGFPGWYLEPPSSLTGKTLSRGVAVVDRVVLRRVVDNSVPQLSAALRARLLALYADDTAELEDLLGRDLAAWRA